jgi:hypothetical protein
MLTRALRVKTRSFVASLVIVLALATPAFADSWTSGTGNVFTASSTKVGIGTSTASGPQLEVQNASGSARTAALVNQASTSSQLVADFQRSGTSRLRIDNSGLVGISNTSPATQLDVVANVSGRVGLRINQQQSNANIVEFRQAGTNRLWVDGSGTVNTNNGLIASANIGNAVSASANGSAGVAASSTNGNGVLATSTNTTGVMGTSSSTTGSGNGVQGTSNGSGSGVYGIANGSGIGVFAQSAGGHGLYATTTRDSTDAAAVYAFTSTFGAFGVIGEQAGNDSGTGVLGKVTDGSGNLVTNGFAVRGEGGGISIYGQNDVGGVGVYGHSSANNGIWGDTNATTGGLAAVRGIIGSNADSTCGAIYGDSGSSSTTWAGKFIGRVEAQSYSTSSDARLKKDIKDGSYGLSDLLKLRPVTYRWKDSSDEAEHNGFIAQEVQKVFPASVSTGGGKTGTMLTVDYTSLIPVAVKAIQQQQAIIEKQERRIAELERGAAPVMSSMFSGGVGLSLGAALLPLGLFVARRRLRRRS